MRFKIFCLLAFNLSAFYLAANEIETINQHFHALVKSEIKQQSIPGVAYTVVKGDRVVASETFGYVDKKKTHKITPNTVFRLASVSKPFASTLVTMLANEHKLKLTDPVTKYVPHFNLAQPKAAQKITLHHILSHSTGLMPNAYDNLLHENWSIDKIIGRFDRVSPICEPEKCYGYQNIAYGMLQPAIESTTKQSYSSLLKQRIFAPLDMKDASVGIGVYRNEINAAKPHVLRKRVRTNKYDRNGKVIKRNIWRTVNVTPDFYKVPTAAGVNASIADMSKWLIANLGYAPETLPKNLLAQLTTPRIKTKKDMRRLYWREHLEDAHYGYGWRIYQFGTVKLIYHSGWVSGFRADIAYAPELDIGFAMLMNAESNSINKLSTEFWTLVYDQLAPKLAARD
ncbi:serine hydrolase domain-containing protein [Thalassotalea sediminis]|uniref:serine hydrolase domain-containing protein n=1 Tax=Thalassotalea sediminis TaxID=1759089 RepID=UPI0025736A45|nr:serine hydrolase domain-containing protein [Thalassotalea sediminis]